MPKGVTSLNIKNENGSFTKVPIVVKAENVKLNNGKNLGDSVAYLDTETFDSGIEDPIRTPLYQEDVVDHLYSSSSITPLSAAQGKVLQNEIDTLKTAGTIPSDTLSSEIIDIRNGANGKVYTSAGTAVRSQLGTKEDNKNKITSKHPITGELLAASKNEKYPTINFLQQFYYENSQVDELIEQAKNQIGTAEWTELKDLRVGADGELYDNAGLSVRTNIQKVLNKINVLRNSKLDDAEGSVTTDNIASKAVTTDKIANGAITALKLANNVVSGSNIADNQISTNHLQSGTVTTDKLADEVKELINGKANKATTLAGYGITDAYTKTEADNATSDLKNVINSQVSTGIFTATLGEALVMRLTDKKWAKNTIVRITVSADESVINGKVELGVTYPSGDVIDIAIPYVNDTVTYVMTDEASRINCYIPKNSVVGDGTVTFKAEYVGILEEVVNLYNSVYAAKAELDTKADKATTLEDYGITDAYTKTEIDTSIENSVSDLKNAVNPQIATKTTSATAGTAIMIRVTNGKWLKNSIIRLSIEADDTVINGKVQFGVTYESGDINNIAVPYANTQAIYITTDVSTRFNCYIPKNSVVGSGDVTMKVEYIGVLGEIVNLHNSIEDIKESLTKNQSYIGKTFSIIGDSYSAYSGWIPEGYNSYYGNDETDTHKSVTSPTQMWWYILSNTLKMPLICNGSWSGTTICTTGYSGADYTASAFITRVKSLFGENNTTAVKPDIIFVFGGTNDDWANSPIGELKYSDWTTDDLKSVLPAFCYLLDYIKLYNPHATIINVVNEGMDAAIATGMATACEHYSAVNIELTGIDKLGGHPSATGQSTIANKIMTVLKSM